jgi:septum formation inhibitor-activating ATPase MinD
MNKDILKFIGIISIPVVLLICFYFWKSPQIMEKENKGQQVLLSDTAAVNRANRTYQRIHNRLLMEDEDYAALYEENEELKGRVDNIKEYTEELENALFNLEQQGVDVSELEDIISNISSECE